MDKKLTVLAEFTVANREEALDQFEKIYESIAELDGSVQCVTFDGVPVHEDTLESVWD